MVLLQQNNTLLQIKTINTMNMCQFCFKAEILVKIVCIANFDKDSALFFRPKWKGLEKDREVPL